MTKFIFKRALYSVFILWVIITVTFFLVHAIPGDPLAFTAKKLPPQIRENFYARYGLDKPLKDQYFIYLKNLSKGQLGESLAFEGRSINTIIKEGFPASLALGSSSILIGFSVGILLGVLAALNKNKWIDYTVMFIALIGVSIPNFVIAALFQFFFTVKIMIFPTTGWGGLKYVVLPTLALSLKPIAIYARFMRNECLEVLSEDYILMAKSKGLPKFSLIKNHLIRNAILPSLTMLGPQIASIITGSFVIESIYGIPGIGNSFVNAVTNMDYSMIIGMTAFIGFLYCSSMLFVDIMYKIIDPRINI